MIPELPLDVIVIAAVAMVAIAIIAIVGWWGYAVWLARRERRLAVRKGAFRELLAGLKGRERELLDPVLRQAATIRDFEALEALLEEQARSAAERPGWLLDAYDRLGLVDKYIERLRTAGRWRDRAFAAELLGRVGSARAVPLLLETVSAARTEDADVREIALRALSRIADPAAVPHLVAALRSADPWLAPRIAEILARHGQGAVEPLMEVVASTDRHPARAWAASVLGEVKAARAFPVLTRALADLDDEVRAKAAWALGQIGDRRAIGDLLDRLLTDPAPFVRTRVAAALGQFQDPEVIERLVRALGDPAWWVRMRSVEALEQIGPAAETALLTALDDADPEIRRRSATALERVGLADRLVQMVDAGAATVEARGTLYRFARECSRELLAELLQHPSPRVRMAILEAIHRAGRVDLAGELARMGRADGRPALRAAAFRSLDAMGTLALAADAALDALGDDEALVRVAALDLVGRTADPEAEPAVTARAGDPDPGVRAAAARALGRLAGAGAAPVLGRLFTDPDREVRAAAAQAAGESGATQLGHALQPLLEDADPIVRVRAATALGLLADPAALPALVRAFGGGGRGTREAIGVAVARLDPSVFPELLQATDADPDPDAAQALLPAVRTLRTPAAAMLLDALWGQRSPALRAEALRSLVVAAPAHALARAGDGLTDPDERVRAAAIDVASELAAAGLAPGVLRLLREDPVPAVRERAALAAGLLNAPGGEADLLAACRPDQPLTVRVAAALAIGACTQESIVARVLDMADADTVRPLLRERVASDPVYGLLAGRLSEVRRLELRALAHGEDEAEAAGQTLAAGMRTAFDPAERIRIVSGLRALQGERARGALLQVARSDPAAEVRAAALGAAGAMLEGDDLADVAARSVADPHPLVRRAAVALFQRVAPERALPMLLRHLRVDDDDPVVLATVGALADSAFPAFMDLALALDVDGTECRLAARVARFIHHPQLAGLLPPMARSRLPEAREEVARLWTYRPELADLPALEALAADPVAAVRAAAATAWSAVGQLARLGDMAADPDPSVRYAVVVAMQGAPAAPALDRLATDPDERVRAAVAAARLLRGEATGLPPDTAPVAVAEAILAMAQVEDLRRVARTEPNPRHRLAAALALSLVGDPVAAQVSRMDPSPEIREQVARMADHGPR